VTPLVDTTVQFRNRNQTQSFAGTDENIGFNFRRASYVYIEAMANNSSITAFVGATSSVDGGIGYVVAPVAGQNNYVLRGNGLWSALSNFGYIEVSYRATSDAGTPTINAWATRALNSTQYLSNTIATLSSNQLLTVPTGTYFVEGWGLFEKSEATVMRIRNITTSSELLRGTTNILPSGSGQVDSPVGLKGRIIVSGSSTLELQYYCLNAAAGTVGLGRYTATDGVATVFAQLILIKLD
jgi:hypothetical protein